MGPSGIPTRVPPRTATPRELAARRLFAEVAVGFLDEEPRVPEAVAALSATRCVAVGLFADAGEHGQDDLPALLAPDWRAAYAGPIGPDPRISELIVGQVGRTLEASVAA